MNFEYKKAKMVKHYVIVLFSMSSFFMQARGPFPIQFSIPESKMINKVPEKDRAFASLIPAQLHTYIYSDEDLYYKDYQRALFAITCKKGGWDCMRHYEIIANGCMPYFLNLRACHQKTMAFLPRHLILEAMSLPGVSVINVGDPRDIRSSSLRIDYERFDNKRYYELLNALLDHAHKYLTTKSMAEYMLRTINYQGGSILFLSGYTDPDYMRECSLIGLKEVLADKVIDIPKIEFLYKSYSGDVKKLYGKGFSYTKIIDDIPVDRDNIEQRIKDKEFELIVYGSVHRGLPFHDLVRQCYHQDNIVYICGEEGEEVHKCPYARWNNLFIREFDAV
jgi:hypothetical protein